MSFLTPSQLTTLTGTFQRHFSQFGTGIGNSVTVYKTPLQVISNPNSQTIFGYNSDSTINSTSDITYVEQSRNIPAMILYSSDIKSISFPQIKTDLTSKDIFIKVDEDGKNYITDGPNEKVLINNQIFNIDTSYKVQNYFGLKFYYFKCTETS